MRALPCLAVLAAPLALTAPAAAETADVDGDGRPDVVRIEAPGQVVVERGGGGSGAFVPFGLSGPLGQVRLSIGGKGRPYVVAVAQLGAAWEGLVLRWDKGAMQVLWRGLVGPAGDDGEYEIGLEARPSGVVRWQHRRELDRCDGAPVELFREGWDEASRGFRAARPSVRLPDSMRVLTATALAATAAPVTGGWYRAAGASTMAGATDAGQLVAPHALDDGDPATAWREDRGGDGSGEMFTFRTTMKGGKAAALRVALPRARPAGNRITALAVLGKDAAYRVELPAGAAETYVATFPAPIDGCVSVVILDVARAGAGNVTALAELGVLADVELTPGGAEAVLARQVATGGLAGESAARALAGRGLDAVMALDAELARADAATQPRLFAALAKIQHPAVVAPVAAALARGTLPDGDRAAAAELLGRLGAPGQAALVELVAGASAAWPGIRVDDGGREVAARVLAQREPLLLVNGVGHGSRALRATIVGLLATAPAPALLGYLRGDGAAPDAPPRSAAVQADLWRALGKAAAGGPATERGTVATAMTAALTASSDDAYELRYRLVAALGELADGTALHDLMTWLGRGPDGALDRALRRVAAGALGTNPSADARQALTRLASDRDIGTRLAAVRGLATEPRAVPGAAPPDAAAVDAADRALATVVSGDAWPELRRAAAAALALRCDRRGPRAALEAAVNGDAELDVRVDALTALVTCRADGIAARLLRLADDGKAELALRDRAVALFGQLHEPTADAPVPAAARTAALDALLERLARWRGQAFSDEAALRLAIRAVTALGALGDHRAADAVLAAARDGAFPELQAAAAAALGALGRACPRAAIVLLRSLTQSEQRGVALAARGAIDRCGK